MTGELGPAPRFLVDIYNVGLRASTQKRMEGIYAD